MSEYQLETVPRDEQQNNDVPVWAATNGIPNGVLLAVFAGNHRPNSSMLGHSETLAPSIAAKMSRSFGMDLNGLQVYRSDAMAGTAMKGVSQGNKVVLSSDVDLNTGAGQAVLGHELSHIHAQSQGIGAGHSGLYNNAALEQKADREGMLAAQGRPIYEQSITGNPGLSYGLGMKGVEGLTPLSSGMSTSAGAPIQAKKNKTDEQTSEKIIPHQSGDGNADNAVFQNAGEQKVVDEQPEEDNNQESKSTVSNKQPTGAEEQEAPVAPQGKPVKEDGVDPSLKQIAPLAWRRPTSGNGGEEKPTLGIHIKQQETGKSSEAGSLLSVNSHAFLSLEYTKRSKVRGRHQRFRSTFGFYPANGAKAFSYAMQGGTTAGELKDDFNHAADVSRSYPITFRQLNTIAEEASDYAKGGYNLFSRNCTTFTADVTEKAGIKIGGEENNIFKKENWSLGPVKRAGYGLLTGIAALFPTDSFTGSLEKQVGKDDLRYGVNGKIATQEDVDREKKTRRRGGAKTFGYAPSATGERLRALQLGGLEGNYRAKEDSFLKEHVERLDENKLSPLWEKAVAEQATQMDGQILQQASEAMRPVFAMVAEMQGAVMPMVKGGLKKDQMELYANTYNKYSPQVNKALHTWYESYGHACPIMGQFVSEMYGLIKYIDLGVLNSIPATPALEDDDNPAVNTANHAISHIVHNNGQLIDKYAKRLAFGNTKDGLEKIRQMDEVKKESPEGKKIKKNEELYEELSIREGNEDYLKTMLYDMLDDRFDQYEANGVGKEDLIEAFHDIPQKELSDNEKTQGLDTESMNSKTGEFGSFSAAMQSASLRMLFGEAPVKHFTEKEGNALALWKESEYESNDDASVRNGISGSHEVTQYIVENQNEKVEMLMNTLAHSPDSENFSPLELAYKTLYTLESLYVSPVLSDQIKEQKGSREKIIDLIEKQGMQQGNLEMIIGLIKSKEVEENELFTDDTAPAQDLVDTLKTMAQKVLNEKKNILNA